MYKFVFFVPVQDAKSVKEAIFEAGAGQMDGYDCCCFEVKGVGQFRPGKSSQPHIGEHNKLEFVDELKIETVCEKNKVRQVLSAFRKAHPYEVPAFDIFETVDPENIGD